MLRLFTYLEADLMVLKIFLFALKIDISFFESLLSRFLNETRALKSK